MKAVEFGLKSSRLWGGGGRGGEGGGVCVGVYRPSAGRLRCLGRARDVQGIIKCKYLNIYNRISHKIM